MLLTWCFTLPNILWFVMNTPNQKKTIASEPQKSNIKHTPPDLAHMAIAFENKSILLIHCSRLITIPDRINFFSELIMLWNQMASICFCNHNMRRITFTVISYNISIIVFALYTTQIHRNSAYSLKTYNYSRIRY